MRVLRQFVIAGALLSLCGGCAFTDRLDTMIAEMRCMNQNLIGMRSEMEVMRHNMQRMEQHTGKMSEAFDDQGDVPAEP